MNWKKIFIIIAVVYVVIVAFSLNDFLLVLHSLRQPRSGKSNRDSATQARITQSFQEHKTRDSLKTLDSLKALDSLRTK